MKYLFFLLLFIAIAGNAEESTPSSKITAGIALELINPVNRTLYSGEDSTLVIQTDSKLVNTLEIIQDDVKFINIEVNSTKNTYCKAVKLRLGDNKIVINAYNNDKLVKSIKRDLYFFADVFEASNEEESEEFDKNYFHSDENEAKCKSCHDMTSNVPTDGEAFEDVTKTTCYSCHIAKVSKGNTHAPTANWLCLDCHNGKTGEYNMDKEGTAKYLVRDPVAKTCAECHDTVDGWFMNKYTHGPTNDGRCNRCHNPHGSDNEFFLRKPVWKLCTTCHDEKATGKHIVSSFVFGRNGGAHPTKDRKDPVRKGRDFYCSSCHNPHGSGGIYLLRMEGDFTFNVCQRCHKK